MNFVGNKKSLLPVLTDYFCFAGMAKLADALASGASGFKHHGSSNLPPSTKIA